MGVGESLAIGGGVTANIFVIEHCHLLPDFPLRPPYVECQGKSHDSWRCKM